MTLTIDIIEGTIQPLTTCAQEYRSPPRPFLQKERRVYSLNDTAYLVEHYETEFDETEPTFWKIRTIAQMIITPLILSITFLPTRRSQHNWLFLQKVDEGEKRVGFVAPYLSPQERREWEASEIIPTCHVISDMESLDDSLETISETAQGCLRTLLLFFLNDPQSQGLFINFQDQDNSLLSVGWIKV